MHLIPVIDLLNGQAVHGIKGEREKYKPVKSVLSNTPDPICLARAFRDKLGLNDLYIADLNEIQKSHSCNRDAIAAISCGEKLNVILDAGIPNAEKAQPWLRLGVSKVVIGSETLRSMDAVADLPTALGSERLIFSLDMHNGQILSRCPQIAAMSPIEALGHLKSAEWRQIILLDLSRVGTGQGVDRTLAIEARTKFPGLKLLVGGGIAAPEQLLDLEYLGISGVLLATALHQGTITAQYIKHRGE